MKYYQQIVQLATKMTDSNSAKVSTGCKGQIDKLRLNEDYLNSWIERFKLYVNLNEINVHKKQLMFLILLGNKWYALIRDLCRPKKPTESNNGDLKNC